MKQLFTLFFILFFGGYFVAQTDSIPLISDKTCEAEIFCTDSVNCGVLPIKLTCDAKSRSKNLPLLIYTYKIDWESDGVIDLTGSKQSITLDANNGLKLGKHKIIWVVKDLNNLQNSCEKTFEVKDCTKPKIFAKKYNYYYGFPDRCSKVFRPNDLIDSTFDNCTIKSNLKIKILKGSYTSIITDSLNKYSDSIVIKNDEQYNLITIFVIDDQRNYSYINIDLYYIDIYTNDCFFNQNTVTCYVKNDENNGVEKVNILVNGVTKQITDASGLVNILLTTDRNYTINCKKILDSRNGVTTADLVAINKYILKIDTFTTKYRNIAADINSDKKVSISDMIELRKLILFINDTFTNSDSWKFIPKDYKFSKIPEADDYPTSISFYLDSPKIFDFIGIKVGDVNGTVKANGLLEAEERSIVAKKINIQNIDLQGNKPIELKLPIAELFDQDGFQLSLRLDPDLVELVSLSGIDADSYHFDEQTGALLIAFVKGFSKGNELVLNLLPKTNCTLLQALSFPESKMKQEYYTQNQSIAYCFEWINPQFELYHSQPNPFSTSTVLRYFSPIRTIIDFDIYNSNGQLVKHQKMTCKDGINEVEVVGNELIGTGVYHCQFKSDLGIFNQKIVFIQ